MLYLLRPERAGQDQRSREEAALIVAELVQEHWLFCNLYTIATKNIRNHILRLYGQFISLIQTRKQRQNKSYEEKAAKFNNESKHLFDIFCTDTETRKKLEHMHGVKMTEMEWKFLDDQRSERKMYCENFVDKKWMKTMERRRKEVQSLETLRTASEMNKFPKRCSYTPDTDSDSQD